MFLNHQSRCVEWKLDGIPTIWRINSKSSKEKSVKQKSIILLTQLLWQWDLWDPSMWCSANAIECWLDSVRFVQLITSPISTDQMVSVQVPCCLIRVVWHAYQMINKSHFNWKIIWNWERKRREAKKVSKQNWKDFRQYASKNKYTYTIRIYVFNNLFWSNSGWHCYDYVVYSKSVIPHANDFDKVICYFPLLFNWIKYTHITKCIPNRLNAASKHRHTT